MKCFWVVAAVLILLAGPAGVMVLRSAAQEQGAGLAREAEGEPGEPEKAEEEGDEPAEEEKEPVYVDSPELYYDASAKICHFSCGREQSAEPAAAGEEATPENPATVVFTQKDVKLYCDEAWYNDENETARAVGHLKIVDPDTTITGDLITADFDEEKMVITGNVVMITRKKKPAEESERNAEQPTESADTSESNPASASSEQEPGKEKAPDKLKDYWEKKTTITCQKAVYYYADDVKKALLYGPVKAVQEDKTVWADEAVFEDLKDMITLTGNVRVLTEDGDDFRCPKAVIAIEEDWLRAEQVSGKVLRRNEEKTEEQPAPLPETAAPASE